MVISAGKSSLECVYNVIPSSSSGEKIHVNVNLSRVKGSNSALGLKRCGLLLLFDPLYCSLIHRLLLLDDPLLSPCEMWGR